MIRDCAGLESSSSAEVSSELDAAGPGEDGSSLCGATVWGVGEGDFPTSEVMGSEESLCLDPGSSALVGNDVVCRGEALDPAAGTALTDAGRLMLGRTGIVVVGVLLMFPSCLADRAEPVRGCAPAAGSEADAGDGATDPLAAAVAFRT